jgi:hypothetical protein
MSNETFDFNSFVKESKEVLVNPKDYFAALKVQGGFTEPLIKAVIYGAVAGIFSFLWSVLNIGPATGSMFGGAIGIMAFIWSIIGAVLVLFIGAVIILIISSICKGNTDFEANVRVSAVLLIIMPISALFGFTSGLNLTLGMIVSLAINLFGLWLLYNALIQTLKAKPETVKVVSYVLIALIVVFMLAGMASRRVANRYLQDFNSQTEELLNDINK